MFGDVLEEQIMVDAVGKAQAKPQRQHRPLQAIGLVADNENTMLQELKYMLTGEALLAQDVLHDPVESVLGIGKLGAHHGSDPRSKLCRRVILAVT